MVAGPAGAAARLRLLGGCESFHHSDLILRSPSGARASRRMAASPSQPVAMVRDGALRAPPHHEAERVGNSIPTVGRAAREWALQSQARPASFRPLSRAA